MTQSIKLQILTLFSIAFLFAPNFINGQSVGVVLSGGGSSGLAHIGVLKALENNSIPIDYITGTSMGAVIGGLYASGHTIEEIELFFTSPEFSKALKGGVDENLTYFYAKDENDASWISIKANRDTLLGQILPTNVLAPVQLDLHFLKQMSGASAVSNYSFDSLFIPFRCVASDVQNKKQVIFSSGELHTAIRASSTYPFFFRPIYVDGTLLFDGGLYNNFPSDVIYNAFSPDVIIGSNVSSNALSPDPDDLFSQLDCMISSPTNFNLPCLNGIIISPKTESFTLDFEDAEKNINIGFDETIAQMDSIKSLISRRISTEEVNIKRLLFLEDIPDYWIDDIQLSGDNESFLSYYEKVISKKKGEDLMSFEDMKSKYIRLFESDKVTYLFPKLIYDKAKGAYDLNLRLYKEKDLSISFGGNLSSRPVNMGFVGLKFNFFGKVPKTIYAKSYFGKFYSALQVRTRFDFFKRTPFYIEPEVMIHQWDYFKSFSTFFEESKPPFILLQDEFVGINIGMPIRNKGVFVLDGKFGSNENNYYQIEDFTPTDTSDLTKLDFLTGGMKYTRSTLNKKQFANSGTLLQLSGRLVHSNEITTPGSTGIIEEDSEVIRNWYSFKIEYENYFKTLRKIKFGYSSSVVYSSKPRFTNYKATILTAPSFRPTPESKSFFQEEFRAHKFGTFGLKVIYNPINKLDVRLESYIFQPVNHILENDLKQAEYEDSFLRRYYIVSTTAVYHTPLGPLSLSVNYYDKREENFSWILNFGYLIFNKRPLD